MSDSVTLNFIFNFKYSVETPGKVGISLCGGFSLMVV